MFDSIKRKLAALLDAPGEINRRAAPRVLEKLRTDATTKRGNIPSFGKMGNIPIRVEVRATGIAVDGPDWVLQKAKEKGQVSEWGEIVREEASDVLEGK